MRRRILTTALVVLGAILFTAGIVALWARLALFRAEGFSALARQTLEREGVQRLVASRVVEEIVERGSVELLTIRPLLESIVRGALATETFQQLFASSVDDLHRTAFSPDQDTLVLKVSDILIVATGVLEKLQPSLAAKLPGGLESAFVQISNRNYATQLLPIVRRLDRLAFLLPLLALAVFAVAAGFRGRGRGAVSAIGTALAVTALSVIFFGLLGRLFLPPLADDPAYAAAAADVADVLRASLSSWLWAVAILGVLLAAAPGLEQRRDLEVLGRLLRQGPTTPGARLLAAAVLFGAGGTLILWPEPLVRLGFQILGLFALRIGAQELTAALRAGGARTGLKLLGRLRIGTLSFSALALACLATAGLLLFVGRPRVARPAFEPAGPIRCNGHAELCERPLDRVAFPCTHNSMSAASEPGWFFASHDRGIPEQLAAGVRGLLVDTHYGVRVKEGVRTFFLDRVDQERLERELGKPFVDAAERLIRRWTPPEAGAEREPYLCHGFCELGATPLVPALRGVRDFLERHPREVLVLFFEDYITPDDTARAFEESGLIDLVHAGGAGKPWPTLGEMIASGGRVLALSEKFGDAPRPPWYHAGFEIVQETPYRYHSPEEFSCRPNRGRPDSPLFLLNHWIERVTPSPTEAAEVNRLDLLLPRAETCWEERGLMPNLVAVNFYARGDLFDVVRRLNALEKPGAADEAKGHPGAGVRPKS